MKKIIFLIALFVTPFLAFSQHESIEKFYNKYMDHEQVDNVSLSGWILQMASKFANEKTGEEVLKKITQLRIMVAQEKNIVTKSDLNQLMKDVRKNDFEDLMTVRDGTDRVHFMIREEGDVITNALVIINGDNEFILLSLEGALDFKDLKELQFDVEGGDVFKKLGKKNPRA